MDIIRKLFQKQDSSFPTKKDFLPYLGILIIVFLIVTVINFPIHSWYTGWDNLHPEFNFGLNFKRALSAVWQENQGLGTYGGHGYAATLPHTIITFLLSFIIPVQYIRSVFTFLALFVGIIGVFFLVRKFLESSNEKIRNTASLFGGLFYLLNFSTVQNFYIQLEAFIIHFSVLPWLLLSLITYLSHKTKKNLLFFLLVTFISSAQGFIPPLFIVYFIILCIFLFFYLMKEFSLKRLKNVLFLIMMTLIINAYWLLPIIYYSSTHSSTYLNAYNNLSSTEDFILKNKKYGDVKDLIFLKGFIIDALDTDTAGNITSIFSQWQNHLDSTLTRMIGYIFFLFILLGLFNLIRKDKNSFNRASFIALLFIFSLLATNTFPFSTISKIIQQFPLLHQAFRVAFTKFSISLSFFYSIAFSMGISFVLSKLDIENRVKKEFYFLSFILICLLVYFSLPTFQGNFLYKRTKLDIPTIYFDLFNYFNKDDSKARIANVPIGWHWGWSVYKWGYSGSGFLWYGIEQPIMDRAFDVWGKYNENYYWESSYAVYSENYPLFDKVMDKYQIQTVLFDKNIIPYPNVKGFSYSDKLENYLDHSGKYALVKVFKSSDQRVNDIKIYKVKHKDDTRDFKSIKLLNNLQNIGPSYEYTDFDQAYVQYGEYYTDSKSNFDIDYPFRTLFTKRQINGLSTDSVIKKSINDVNLIYDSNIDSHFIDHSPASCGSFDYHSSQAKQNITANNILQFTSVNTENCYSIFFDDLTQRDSYLISIENRHIQGKRLQVSIINHDSKRTDIEISLTEKNSIETNYVIIPPMKYYGLGYSLAFNNISIGDTKTINELKNIKIYKLPYQLLIEKQKIARQNSINQNKILIYYQSFDPDWKAWQNGKELKDHVLVNNWANGWLLPPGDGNIVIIFWPQYLEYIGFILLAVSFFAILLIKEKNE